MKIARHKTAIRRVDHSRPVRLALADALITGDTSVFDYGCGHGADVRLLRQRGVDAAGWDPVHLPDGVRREAAVVNLGYVLNVIEDAGERAGVLVDAWGLATDVLVVSARLDIEARRQKEGTSFADGCLTGSGTFQKFFEQQELRQFIDVTLGVESVATAPGVFFVFRDGERREAFIASRFRRRTAQPRLRRADVLFEEHRAKLDLLMDFVAERGRLPEVEELLNAEELLDVFGSLKRAFAVVRRVTGRESWEEIEALRREDMLLFLALAAFPRRPKFSAFSPGVQRDVRALFGTYKRARTAADELLFAAGQESRLRSAARGACVGKRMPDAIYVHSSALDQLPTLLRVYEGCARVLIGHVPDATLVKLQTSRPRVSYLEYREFDREPHPSLRTSTSVRLDKLKVTRRHYADDANPPILHRKEEFVPDDYPERAKFARLTAQEEKWGLYASPAKIGMRDGWDAVLATAGAALKGHRVVRRK